MATLSFDERRSLKRIKDWSQYACLAAQAANWALALLGHGMNSPARVLALILVFLFGGAFIGMLAVRRILGLDREFGEAPPNLARP